MTTDPIIPISYSRLLKFWEPDSISELILLLEKWTSSIHFSKLRDGSRTRISA